TKAKMALEAMPWASGALCASVVLANMLLFRSLSMEPCFMCKGQIVQKGAMIHQHGRRSTSMLFMIPRACYPRWLVSRQPGQGVSLRVCCATLKNGDFWDS